MTSPSCRDLTSESSYHMLLMGLLLGVPGYGDSVSNREEGQSYYDLRLSPEARGGGPLRGDQPVITVEFKACSMLDMPFDSAGLARTLNALAAQGLEQIERKGYDCELPAGCLRYGIAFGGKSVAVVCERR